MSGIRSLSEVVGIDTAKRLTMTAQTLSGKEAHDLGLVTEVAAEPVTAAEDFARELATRSPDALAAAKRLLNSAYTDGTRRPFATEPFEQPFLLVASNPNAAPPPPFPHAIPASRP